VSLKSVDNQTGKQNPVPFEPQRKRHRFQVPLYVPDRAKGHPFDVAGWRGGMLRCQEGMSAEGSAKGRTLMAIDESKRAYRLADALVLLLLSMVPVMVLIAAAEGQAVAPTMLFWLLLLLPMVLVAWLVSWRDPEESTNGHRIAAIRVPRVEGLAAEFEQLVAPFVRPSRSYLEAGIPVVEGTPLVRAEGLFSQLERRLAPRRVIPFIEELEGGMVRVVGLPGGVDARLRTRSSPAVHLLLFVAAVITAVYAGARQQGVNLLEEPGLFPIGLPYALSLLTILGVHELGHYAMARRHGVEVTLPYFIPFPMGLGTLGAFIQMKSLIKTRRAIFDIGIAGPLAGLVIALPLLYFGVTTQSAPADGGNRLAVEAGSSMFLALLHELAYGADIGTTAVNLSPVAFAAWIGVLVTALNLLPVGQLDGGHIAYALFGRRHARVVSIATVSLMAGLGLVVWPGLLTWALIVTLIAGFSHMPALDDLTPPDGKRFALGVLTLALPILIVLPVPGALRAPTLDSPYQGRLLLSERAR
jgi:membrane-associated protease RseP (regulator of RpoE activity)